MTPTPPDDLDVVRLRLAASRGRRFWRDFEELAASPAVQEFLQAEFPSQAKRFGGDAVARRDFLHLMGASLALAGLGACTRQPREEILAYGKDPESTVPGRPRFFATAVPSPHGALGVLVESHEGRPTKVEGNPDHPSSLGATDALAQAEVLTLYDPDRSRTELRAGQISTWDAFLQELGPELERFDATEGAGLRVLSEPLRSPTLARQRDGLSKRYPRMRWHCWQPLGRDRAREGALLAFGRDVVVDPDLARADVVLALEADFLASGPGGVRHARAVADRRRARAAGPEPCRLYAVEGPLSVTGAYADHRLRLRPSELEGFVRALASRLGLAVEGAAALDGEAERFLAAVADDLAAHAGAAAVLVGEPATPATHAIVHAINHRLTAHGRTLHLRQPAEHGSEDGRAALRELVGDLDGEKVEALVILGGNPVYTAPAELDFAAALRKARFRVHLALHEDETSELCLWHLPEAHLFERWSDVRDHDGTVTIQQPLIEPLYDGLGPHRVVAALAGDFAADARALVRGAWRAMRTADSDADFETFWRHTLHDGVARGTQNRSLALEPQLSDELARGSAAAEPGLELAIRAGANVGDGRHANNGWLQELPQPLSRLTWGNAAHVSPATAGRLGVKSGDVVELRLAGARVEAPVWVQPGQADELVLVHLGYGRRAGGRVAAGVGFDAQLLRGAENAWGAGGLALDRTGRRTELASVQDHGSMEGRDIVRVLEFDRFRAAQEEEHEGGEEHGGHDPSELSLYPEHEYPGHAWGMVIDQSACIGCNACMIACQAENNVPVVGVEEVRKGREMHWLRIDRYYEGEPDAPAVHHQPVPCMHCERAPCEVVCPVAATVHGAEGLNEMVYNRCIGTRYCANNCPYKVRRFNFFLYADYETEVLKLGRNPDVTVRTRGVMEKCTYCVQRINQARIAGKKDERGIADGDVVTACQAACPTQAIAFGDLNDERSAVARLRHEPHHYALLEELGTKPRTTYLAKVVHKNPGLEGG